MSAILDPDRLASLRRRAGLTQRALGRRLRVSMMVIAVLEDPAGRNHRELSLGVLQRLADALGVEPAYLFASPGADGGRSESDTGRVDDDSTASDKRAAGDDAVLEALLSERGQMTGQAQLATALGWELGRVHRAATALHDRLMGSGQRLQRGWGLALRPAADKFTLEQLERLERASLDQCELRTIQAQLVRDIIAGRITARWEGAATNPKRVAIASLRNLGLVQLDRSTYVPSEDLAFSLGLDE